MMKNSTSRIIIETIVRKAIKDIKDSPKRSTRNLVDMALNFSNGKFQQLFFQAVQTMLETESSVYYDLVHDIVTHTDTERLITFGMNLGYNSCTLGARQIRNLSETEQMNVPWSVILHLDPDHYLVHQEQYKQAITQGEAMGIYTWQFAATARPELFLPLVSEHPDSAFILFCDPAEITAEFLYDAAELNNLMLTVPWDMLQDCSFINEIISSKAYSVVFGADGTLYMNCPECSHTGYNLFDSDLKNIFQQLNIK